MGSGCSKKGMPVSAFHSESDDDDDGGSESGASKKSVSNNLKEKISKTKVTDPKKKESPSKVNVKKNLSTKKKADADTLLKQSKNVSPKTEPFVKNVKESKGSGGQPIGVNIDKKIPLISLAQLKEKVKKDQQQNQSTLMQQTPKSGDGTTTPSSTITQEFKPNSTVQTLSGQNQPLSSIQTQPRPPPPPPSVKPQIQSKPKSPPAPTPIKPQVQSKPKSPLPSTPIQPQNQTQPQQQTPLSTPSAIFAPPATINQPSTPPEPQHRVHQPNQPSPSRQPELHFAQEQFQFNPNQQIRLDQCNTSQRQTTNNLNDPFQSSQPNSNQYQQPMNQMNQQQPQQQQMNGQQPINQMGMVENNSYQFDLNRISQSQQQQQGGNVTYQEQPRVLQLEQTQQFVNLPRANDYYTQMNDQLLQQQIVEYYQRLMQQQQQQPGMNQQGQQFPAMPNQSMNSNRMGPNMDRTPPSPQPPTPQSHLQYQPPNPMVPQRSPSNLTQSPTTTQYQQQTMNGSQRESMPVAFQYQQQQQQMFQQTQLRQRFQPQHSTRPPMQFVPNQYSNYLQFGSPQNMQPMNLYPNDYGQNMQQQPQPNFNNMDNSKPPPNRIKTNERLLQMHQEMQEIKGLVNNQDKEV
ncbi:hypothetical protein RDWZM_004713 [Blomia tropicalis]|uniref:Uncharacterized protein n=1 Tax=Blomia tropicalis TaxID=40697 RepID=A0A9Q0RLN4_BLOTA|nr:hypothetical protein RDWZM_004713 [Blomia tropicalis]